MLEWKILFRNQYDILKGFLKEIGQSSSADETETRLGRQLESPEGLRQAMAIFNETILLWNARGNKKPQMLQIEKSLEKDH